MTKRRICLDHGPCRDSFLNAGGFFSRPPLALWAVRDPDGDVGCINGDPATPPALGAGEEILGCYRYVEEGDRYEWHPAAGRPWPPGPYPDDHHARP